MTEEFDKKVQKWLEDTDQEPPASGTWEKKSNYIPPYLRTLVKNLMEVREAAVKARADLETELTKGAK